MLLQQTPNYTAFWSSNAWRPTTGTIFFKTNWRKFLKIWFVVPPNQASFCHSFILVSDRNLVERCTDGAFKLGCFLLGCFSVALFAGNWHSFCFARVQLPHLRKDSVRFFLSRTNLINNSKQSYSLKVKYLINLLFSFIAFSYALVSNFTLEFFVQVFVYRILLEYVK